MYENEDTERNTAEIENVEDAETKNDSEFENLIDEIFGSDYKDSPLEAADKIINNNDIANGHGMDFNTWPMGTQSSHFPRLFVLCREPYCLNEALHQIDEWCKGTVKLFPLNNSVKRSVIFYTDKWDPDIFARYEANILDYVIRKGIHFKIKFMNDYGVKRMSFIPEKQDRLNKFFETRFWGKFDTLIDQLALEQDINFNKRKDWLNVNGISNLNITFEDIRELGLPMATEVGVGAGGAYFCPRLFGILLRNPHAVDNIENHYKGCKFARYVRLSFKAMKPLYFEIKQYDSLDDFIKEINAIGITNLFKADVSKRKCVNDLAALGVTSAKESMDRLQKYNPTSWDWLEYLRIIEPPIDILPTCARGNIKAEDYLKAKIENHISGMRLIDTIANLVP